jgi:hypothetical protein
MKRLMVVWSGCWLVDLVRLMLINFNFVSFYFFLFGWKPENEAPFLVSGKKIEPASLADLLRKSKNSFETGWKFASKGT